MTDAFTIACQQDSTEIGSCIATCPMQAKNIDIVPVRYAIDARNDSGDIVNGLPDTWRYDGVFSKEFKSKKYTTRQLRDGWLYVYSAAEKQCHEYQIIGSDFIKQDIQSWSQSKGEQERGGALSTASFLTYSNTENLYLAWSKYRWSWPLMNNVLSSSSTRQKLMRQLHLPSIRTKLEAPHAGLISSMGPMVADIDNPEVDFSTHCVQTQAVEEEHEHLSVKKMITSSSMTSAMSDPQSACFVVLDDMLSDVTDLYLHLANTYAKQVDYLSTDDVERKLMVASIARMYSQATVNGITGVPDAVLNDPIMTLEFEQALNAYLSVADVQNRISPTYGYTDPKVEETKQRLMTEFKFTPKKESLLEYQMKSRYRDEIRWGELNAFYNDHVHTLAKMNDNIVKAYSDLMAALMHVGTDLSLLGVDLDDKTHLTSVLPLFTEMVELVVQTALNEETQELLEKAINAKDPQSLLPLVPYGLSLALKGELDKTLLETSLLTSTGDGAALSGRIAEIETLFGHDGINSGNWYGALTESLKSFLNNFVNVVNGSMKGVFERVLAVLFPIMEPTSGFGKGAYQLQGIVLSSLFSGEAVIVNKDYGQQVFNYNRRYQSALTKVNQLKQIKSGGIVRPLYLQQLRQAENELAMVMTAYPERVTLKNTALNAAIRADIRQRVQQSITTGKAVSIKAYNELKGLGGLVAFLNVWNFTDQWKGNDFVKADGSIDAKGTRVILAAGAWTGNAIADVFRGSLLGTVSKNNLVGITIKELSDRNFSLAFKLGSASFFMGALGIIASITEAVQTYYDIQGARESEVGAMKLKLIALGGQFIVFSYITGATLGSIFFSVKIAGIFTALASFGLVVFGLLYLFGTLLGNYLKKNALEEWLIKSIWGNEYQGISAQAELEDYLALMAKPTISLSTPIYNMPEYGVIKVEVPDNYIDSDVYLNIEHIKKIKVGYPLNTYRNEIKVLSGDDLNIGGWIKEDNQLYYSLQITLSSKEDEVRIYFVDSEKDIYTNKVVVNQQLSLMKKNKIDAFLSEKYTYMPLSISLLGG